MKTAKPMMMVSEFIPAVTRESSRPSARRITPVEKSLKWSGLWLTISAMNRYQAGMNRPSSIQARWFRAWFRSSNRSAVGN